MLILDVRVSLNGREKLRLLSAVVGIVVLGMSIIIEWSPLLAEISSNWQTSVKEVGGSVADVARNGMLGVTNERNLFTSEYAVRNFLPHCGIQ